MGIGVGGWIYHFCPLRVLRLEVPSIVGVQGSHSGGGHYRVVESVLGQREEVYPVVLLLIEEGPEVCFDNLADSFGLSIGLGVKGRGHAGADSCDGEEIHPGIACEPGFTVGHDVSRYAVEVLYFPGEYPG